MTEMQPADEIIEGLWMGSVQAGKLAATGVGDFDVIVNLTGDPTNWDKNGHNKTYVNFRFSDGALPDLGQVDALVEFIAAALRAEKKVLVHCTMGCNRSGLVCALAARRMKGLTGIEALRLIRQKRRVVGTFVSPGTGDRATNTALFNSEFVKYVESLP